MISGKNKPASMRIGVLGGTFDPVHFGHLLLAEDSRRAARLDRVLFMPVRVQPFKQGQRVSPASDRMEMLRLATADNPAFDVTEIETSREGVSYTIDSLRGLRKEYGGAVIYFILGTDMFLSLDKWYRHEELLASFAFVAGRRPGYREAALAEGIERYRDAYNTEICVADNTCFDVSSTEIRRRASVNDSIRYLTPDSVCGYIEKKRLYEDYDKS